MILSIVLLTNDGVDLLRVIKLLKDVHALGNKATVCDIVTNSSNRGVARIAMVLGNKNFTTV